MNYKITEGRFSFRFEKKVYVTNVVIFLGLFLVVGIIVKRSLIGGKAKYADPKIKLLYCIKFDRKQTKERCNHVHNSSAR